MNIDDKIQDYIELRVKKLAAQKRFKELIAPTTERMDKIENEMLAHLQAEHLQNVKGAHGTASQQVKRSFKAEDWEEFASWCGENEMTHLIQKRPSDAAVKEYVDEYTELPPGLSMNAVIKVIFRKS